MRDHCANGRATHCSAVIGLLAPIVCLERSAPLLPRTCGPRGRGRLIRQNADTCLAPKALISFLACGQRPWIFGQNRELALKARLIALLTGLGHETIALLRDGGHESRFQRFTI
jgi:hypothetical protein